MRLSRRAAAAGLLSLSVTPAMAATPLRREIWAPVDGARLYLELRGEEPGAPVLLWLHGGPGGAERPLFRLYDGALERRFVVAYLDQRGAGRSYDPKADPGRLTIAQHLADLDAVVDLLRRETGRDRVILLGHSWGAALGLLYGQAHPEKVGAYLGVGVPVATLACSMAQLEFVSAEAQRRGDDRVLAEIARIGPPPLSASADLTVGKLADRYGGVYHRRPNQALAVVRALAQGLVSPGEVARIIEGNNVSLQAMNAEIAGLDLRQRVSRIEIPVGFLLGRHDRHTDARLAAVYFETLQAPRKTLVWFDNSAHNPPFEEPERFVAAVPQALRELGVPV